jgi:hypothetical protein
VVVAVELFRLLRRGLLVVTVAAAGWLLSAVFAGSASADELPGDRPGTQQQPSGGLLGSLLGGVTNTLTSLTDSVVDVTGSVLDTTSTLLSPITQPATEPIVDVPEILPVDDWSGANSADRPLIPPAPSVPPAPSAAPVPPVSVAPAPPPAAPAPVRVAPVASEPAVAPVPRQAVANDNEDGTGQHANRDPAPEPVKTPADPSAPGTTVSAAHDTWGGARGTHGVLISHATLAHPADAGFTTRSRAANAAGRDTGLPVSTPD